MPAQVVSQESKRALTEAEAARYVAMSRSFLRQDRMNGPRRGRTHAPPYIKIGRTVRYLIEDLDAWLLSHRVPPKESAVEETAE